jgi:hypothetical protein
MPMAAEQFPHVGGICEQQAGLAGHRHGRHGLFWGDVAHVSWDRSQQRQGSPTAPLPQTPLGQEQFGVHRPTLQLGVLDGHTFPQLPQLLLLELRSTHTGPPVPVQSVSPAGHMVVEVVLEVVVVVELLAGRQTKSMTSQSPEQQSESEKHALPAPWQASVVLVVVVAITVVVVGAGLVVVVGAGLVVVVGAGLVVVVGAGLVVDVVVGEPTATGAQRR